MGAPDHHLPMGDEESQRLAIASQYFAAKELLRLLTCGPNIQWNNF